MAVSITNVLKTPDNRGYIVGGMSKTPGQRIKEARNARGWSQDKLGKTIGISQPAVKKVEDGTTKNSRHLLQLAAVLGIKLNDIMPGLDLPEADGSAVASDQEIIRLLRDVDDDVKRSVVTLMRAARKPSKSP